MHHVAIMNPKVGSIDNILSGKKTIESRWYLSRKAPWNKIKPKDTIFFKYTGQPVSVKASVTKIKQYDYLQPQKVREILKAYALDGKLCPTDYQKFYQLNKNKLYCILIFFKNPKPVRPFDIDKTGFGISSAWLCVKNIKDIKKS